MRPSVRVLALGVTVLTLASPAGALEPPDPATGTTVRRVRIVDFRFRPRSMSIDRGTVVRWRNTGDVNHTTTANNGAWDSGTMPPGDTFRRRFRRRGTFNYHCTIHPDMTATITVV